eukprot:548965-Lingulodinium_polyedra.AAC.1
MCVSGSAVWSASWNGAQGASSRTQSLRPPGRSSASARSEAPGATWGPRVVRATGPRTCCMRGVERLQWESVGTVKMSRRRDGARHACTAQCLPPATPRVPARLSRRLCECSCRGAVDGRNFASDYKRP